MKTQEAIKIIQSVMKKAIPQKPLPDNRYYGNGKCPCCNAVFLDKTTNYCGNYDNKTPEPPPPSESSFNIEELEEIK